MIPPAWQDVWICPWPNGHLQAVGTDDAGRRQYLYHPDWRVRRDGEKFRKMLTFGKALSKAREQVLVDLGAEGMTQERACAVAVRLLDLGLLPDRQRGVRRGEQQLRADHARTPARAPRGQGAGLRLHRQVRDRAPITIDDPGAVEALEVMRRRRGGDDRLLAWKDGRRWRSGRLLAGQRVRRPHDRHGGHGQGLPDLARDGDRGGLAGRGRWRRRPKTARKRADVAAMKEVAEFLGNTPALARSSYVDPRVVDAFEEGSTIEAADQADVQDRRRQAGGARAGGAPAAEGVSARGRDRRAGRHHHPGGRRGRQRRQQPDARRRRRRRRDPPGRRSGRPRGLRAPLPRRAGHRRRRLDDGGGDARPRG